MRLFKSRFSLLREEVKKKNKEKPKPRPTVIVETGTLALASSYYPE